MTAIQINDLTKTYGNQAAVDHLSLTVEKGELFSLLGINGAGKSTTIRLLSCLTKPTGGDALIFGSSILSDPMAVKEKISVSPQETAVAPNLTVRENLEFMCRVYGHPHKIAREKAQESIRQFGLAEIERKTARKLSGGWQRRLSIAMALIPEPQILFLDEPTLGLDVIARRELWRMIEQLKGKITVILTTHYLEEAEALSDRIAILANGKLKALGTPGQLKAQTGTERLEDAFLFLVEKKEELR